MIKKILYFKLNVLKRNLIIWRSLFFLLFQLWIDSLLFKFFIRNNIKKEKIQRIRARWFTDELIKLGSAFIKIGQLLSARPDLIPKTWIEELTTLQDSVPQFSFEIVEGIISSELKEKFLEVKKIDPLPIGSASLAQVHKATLFNESEVEFRSDAVEKLVFPLI